MRMSKGQLSRQGKSNCRDTEMGGCLMCPHLRNSQGARGGAKGVGEAVGDEVMERIGWLCWGL